MGESLLSRTSKSIVKLVDRMKWYPAVTTIVWILPTVVRIGEANGWYSQSLADTARFFVYLQGFMDCLAYMLTSPLLSLWREILFPGSIHLARIGKSSGSSRHERQGGENYDGQEIEYLSGDAHYDSSNGLGYDVEDSDTPTNSKDFDIAPLYAYSDEI